MKFIVAFFMAWGNFITIPCPYKRWDSSLKNMMLAFLPSVGAVIGVLWMALYWLLNYFGISAGISAVIMMLYIFYVCGFMHMDGFMDCNDAIMSRRELAERQRILKDSSVGAFAVISVIFLLLLWFAVLESSFSYIEYGTLLLIPVISRGIAGMCVLSFRPIGHSQYAEDYGDEARGKYRAISIVQMVIAVLASIVLSGDLQRTILIGGVTVLAGLAACRHGRKQLGGMSGDIAGYMICLSEAAGILAAAVI